MSNIQRYDNPEQTTIQKEHDYSKLKCPYCKSPLRKLSWGIGCTGYSEGCRFSIPNPLLGATLGYYDIQNLVELRDTKAFFTFESKKKPGKTFKAKLALDDENKSWKFVF